jgi:PAS domain S-box-containing protein
MRRRPFAPPLRSGSVADAWLHPDAGDADVLRVLLDSVPALVVVLDPDGRIERFNRACQELTGYAEADVVGRTVQEFLLAADEVAAVTQVIAQLGEGRHPSRYRNDWVTCDGERRPIAWSNTVVRDASGAVRHIIGMGMDLTAQLRAEAMAEALRVSEMKYAGIVSLAADAIISVDESQRIVLFNGGAQQIFGWSAGEATGQPLDILIPERFREEHRRRHVPQFGGTVPQTRLMGGRQEIRGLRRSGEEFPAEASISSMVVGGERVFTMVLRDITARKRLEAAQKFLIDAGIVLASSLDYTVTLKAVAGLVVDGLADLCVVDIADGRGAVTRLEAAHRDPAMAPLARRLAEFPLDRTREHLVSDVLSTRRPVLVSEVTPAVLDRVAQDRAHRALLESFAPVSYMAVPLLAREQLLGVILCVSSSRRFDDDDLELAQELARRAALAVDNARLYSEANQAIQARDDVVSIVAHDLGNPLSAIRVATSLLLRTTSSVEDGTLMWQQLGAIRSCTENMDRLITSLLDLRRIEAGRMVLDRRPCTAPALLDAVIPAFRLLAQEKRLTLDVRCETATGEYSIDRDRLGQVIENLLGNAVKFTPPGGRITVRASDVQGALHIAVADTGPGVHPGQLPHLFDRFWQARHSGGRSVGLGLSIAAGITEAHGGRIRVESEPGNGATFHVEIPAASLLRHAPAAGGPFDGSPAAGGMRSLA